jgi:hypothetical protein
MRAWQGRPWRSQGMARRLRAGISALRFPRPANAPVESRAEIVRKQLKLCLETAGSPLEHAAVVDKS